MKINFKSYLLYFVFTCFFLNLSYSYAHTIDKPKPAFYRDVSKPFFQFNNGNTLFQNPVTYSSASSVTIDGEIYCSSSSIYTFDFAYDGSGGSYAVYTPGSNANIFINNGRAVRKVTMNLSPGINYFSIVLNFNGANQYGYASLKIDQINGITSGNEAGFVDLVVQGQSELQENLATSTFHWVCKNCYMLNSTGTSVCVDCGKSRL